MNVSATLNACKQTPLKQLQIKNISLATAAIAVRGNPVLSPLPAYWL